MHLDDWEGVKKLERGRLKSKIRTGGGTRRVGGGGRRGG